MAIDFPELVDLKPHTDERGCLVYIENGNSIKFEPKRAYYIYNTPDRETIRGLHGHKQLQQLMIAVCGSFTVRAFNGVKWRDYELNVKDQGLLFKPGLWREITNFSSDAVCLVLASDVYDPVDYIHDIDDYQRYVAQMEVEV